eukprot:Rhum_TRINITY_DN14551_c19_g1::Rhum_TRINITY_DN14551_c19_g1_i1::g.95946::m.95946
MSSRSVTLKELNLLRLSRDAIQKWLHSSEFKGVMTGLFCRVVVRDARSNKCYRVAQVLGLERKGTPERPDVSVLLAHGRHEKTYSLDFVSNGAFTQEEMSNYMDTMEKDGIAVISVKEVETKLAEMRDFVKRSRGSADGAADAPAASAAAAPAAAASSSSAAAAAAAGGSNDDVAAAAAAAPAQPVPRPQAPEASGRDRERDYHRGEIPAPVAAPSEPLPEPLARPPPAETAAEQEKKELQSLVERLEKEVAKRTAESAILEAGLNNERASQKVYKVKIKEMDVVVQQQAALIQELQLQLEHERTLQSSIATKRNALIVQYKELQERVSDGDTRMVTD